MYPVNQLVANDPNAFEAIINVLVFLAGTQVFLAFKVAPKEKSDKTPQPYNTKLFYQELRTEER